MREKKTVEEMLAFAVKEFKAANIRNAQIAEPGILSSVSLRVVRGFGLEGTITARADVADGYFAPSVSVSFSGSHRDVVRATAFMHLVDELTLLAASLQAMLDDEFNAGTTGGSS